jgi:hypothetical protein
LLLVHLNGLTNNDQAFTLSPSLPSSFRQSLNSMQRSPCRHFRSGGSFGPPGMRLPDR